jgi:hypothetical protein
MASFLFFDKLPDHQEMLACGDLLIYDPETMHDRTIFVSHQCATPSNPVL